jgi:hypothetical protein
MSSSRASAVLLAVGLSAGTASESSAQAAADQVPAHVSVVEGQVFLDRDAQSQPIGSGGPFLPGDRLRSTVGRAEILFPDGSALYLDDGSSVELLSAALMRMTAGRILLVVAGSGSPDAASVFQIDTPAASVITDGPGEFRVSLIVPGQTELAVLRGWATLTTAHGDVAMGAGERVAAAAGMPPSTPLAARLQFRRIRRVRFLGGRTAGCTPRHQWRW